MKKILIVILCMLMIFAMTACGDNGGTEEPVDNPTVEQGDDKDDQNTDSSEVTIDKLLKVKEANPEDFFFMSDGEGGCELVRYDGTDELVYVPAKDGENSVKVIGLAFSDDSLVKGVRLPDTVTTINEGAFALNSNLQVVYLGRGTKTIDVRAFGSCSSLYDVRLNDGLEKIDYHAFRGCKSLKSITIPSSVAEIADDAFVDCAEDFTICGTAGSYAETFANEQGYTFEAI